MKVLLGEGNLEENASEAGFSSETLKFGRLHVITAWNAEAEQEAERNNIIYIQKQKQRKQFPILHGSCLCAMLPNSYFLFLF